MKAFILLVLAYAFSFVFVKPAFADARHDLIHLARELKIVEDRRASESALNSRIKTEQAWVAQKGHFDHSGFYHAESELFNNIRLIYKLFGSEARMAVAIARSESSVQCQRYHWNNDSSVDFGVFQINIVHQWRFGGIKMDNCQKNIEVAYQIYSEEGWNPWVTYQKKSYIWAL